MLTTKFRLALPVRFGTMTALTTGARRVGRVYRVQGHTSKSSFVAKERTQLCKSPGGMTRTLGTSNRALGSFPNVPEFLNRYSLSSRLGFLNNPLGDDMIRVLAETGFFPREFLEMALGTLCPAVILPTFRQCL